MRILLLALILSLGLSTHAVQLGGAGHTNPDVVPTDTSCTNISEAALCWDSDDDSLYMGNGTAAQQISSGVSGDVTDVFDCGSGDCSTIVMGAADSLNGSSATAVLQIPVSATPATSLKGQIAVDTVCDALVTTSCLEVHDGSTLQKGYLTAVGPSDNGQVMMFNSGVSGMVFDYTMINNGTASSNDEEGDIYLDTDGDGTVITEPIVYVRSGASDVAILTLNAAGITFASNGDYLAYDATSNGMEVVSAAGGNQVISIVVVDYGANASVGDGQAYVHIPSTMDSMVLVDVHAEVITAGTTGTLDIQVYNMDTMNDMLSTVITIDSAETGSDSAATPAVIDTMNDDVMQNNVLRIDIDAVHTTPSQGLIVTLEFS